MQYLVEPYRAFAAPEEAILLGDREAAVAQGSADDHLHGIRKVIIAHGAPHAVMAHLHSPLHGAVRQQLERCLKSGSPEVSASTSPR